VRNAYKLLSIAIVPLFIISAAGGIMFWSNLNVELKDYQNYLQYQHDISTSCLNPAAAQSGPYDSVLQMCAKANVVLTTQDHSANLTYVDEGFYASCLWNCNGVVYREDPTAIMVNTGHDFWSCKFFGASEGITCTSADVATKMELSTSSASLVATDTGCGGGAGSGQITSGGLADSAGTFTAGTPSAGSVTDTLAHTWTAAETDSNVQVQCVNTELHSGGNIVLVYEFNLGPLTLTSGNTLAITDSLSLT